MHSTKTTPQNDDASDVALPIQKTLVGLAFFIASNYKAAVTQWVGVIIFATIFIVGAVSVLKFTAPIIDNLKETSYNLREAISDLQELRNLTRSDIRKFTP